MAQKFLILAAGIAATAFAHAATITASPGEVDRTISTDGKTAVSITTQFDVLADFDITGLVLDATDLTAGKIVVDKSNIKFVATQVNLTGNAKVPVPVVIGGLKTPGTYTASLTLRDPKATARATVMVNVILTGKPAVNVGVAGLATFGCFVNWSCLLAEMWIPARLTIPIDNIKGAGPAEIGPPKVVIRATRSDTTLYPEVKTPDTLAIGDTGLITLKAPNRLAADRYQVSVRMPVNDADDPAIASVTLDVRHTPWIALLTLAVGILLGRFVQSMNTPQALSQQRLFASLVTLQAATNGVKDTGMALLLSGMIEDLRQDISQMVKSEADLTQSLTNLSTAIDLANHIERLAEEAKTLDAASQAAMETDLTTARSLLLQQDFTDAEAARLKAQQVLLSAAGNKATAVAPKAEFTPSFHFIKNPQKPRRPARLKMLQAFAGTEAVGPEVKFAYTKPILFGLLLIGLLILGMYTLYVKNTTFGADIVYDYFSLVAWGLSADVAQRTLQGLQIPK